MKPIFQFTPNSRQFMDRISGSVPANTSVVFRRLEKGYSAYFNNTADLDSFGVVTGVKTIAMVIKPTADTKLLQDDGTDRIEINGGNISGMGLTECTVNTVNTDAVSNNVWSLVIAEFSGGIDFSTDLEIDVTADIDIVSIVCYDTILSNLEKGNLWYNFNHMSPTSTATTINHHIPVDPTGSVLCHDYQNWRGGIIPDLSGNGNDGTVNGFVDCGINGARFDGISYFNAGQDSSLDVSHITIETLLYLETLPGAYKRLISKGKVTGVVGSNPAGAWELNFLNGVNKFDFILNLTTNGKQVVIGDLALLAKQLYYVVCTYDGLTMKMLVNGIPRGSASFTDTIKTKATDLLIGVYSGGKKFTRISSYALTEAKIQANWNEIANQAIFNEPMFNQLPDSRSYTTGMYLENWQVSSGTFTVNEDSTGTYIECTGNGVIQYKGIDFSMYKENGFIKKIVGDISSDQGVTVDTAVNVAFASNVLSVTLTTGQKLYELVITKGEEV